MGQGSKKAKVAYRKPYQHTTLRIDDAIGRRAANVGSKADGAQPVSHRSTDLRAMDAECRGDAGGKAVETFGSADAVQNLSKVG